MLKLKIRKMDYPGIDLNNANSTVIQRTIVTMQHPKRGMPSRTISLLYTEQTPSCRQYITASLMGCQGERGTKTWDLKGVIL